MNRFFTQSKKPQFWAFLGPSWPEKFFFRKNFFFTIRTVERANRTGLNFSIFKLFKGPIVKPTIFLSLQAAPEFQRRFGEKLAPRPQKSKFSKNQKWTPTYFKGRNFRGRNFREAKKSRNFWNLLSRMVHSTIFCQN